MRGRPGKTRWAVRTAWAALAVWAMLSVAPAPAAPAIPEGEEWFVLTKGDEPVGYAYNRVTRIGEEENAKYQLTGELVMTLVFGGTEIRTVSRSTDVFREDLRLLTMDSVYEIGGVRTVLRGTVKGEALEYTVSKDGAEPVKKSAEYRKGCIPASALPLYLSDRMPKPGRPVEVCVLSTQLTRVAAEETEVAAGPRETVRYEGNAIGAWTVRAKLDGVPMVLKLGEDGRVYEAVQPTLGFIQTRVEREDLTRLGTLSAWDPFASTIKPANVRIDDPGKLAAMQVVIGWSGVDRAKLSLASDMQEVVKEPGRRGPKSAVVRITLPRPPEVPKRAPAARDLEPYLACAGSVDCDDEAVRQAAAEIAGDVKEPRKAAMKIADWIQRNIVPDPVSWKNPTDAAETLRSKAGMSKHNAVLFAALARARGIPVKICAGKRYNFGVLVTHYWNEYYAEGWRTADSTQGSGVLAPLLIKLADGGAPEGVGAVLADLEPTLEIVIKHYR